MPDPVTRPAPESPPPSAMLEQGTYEVIRNRLATHGADLKARLERLNQSRQEVFGTLKTALVATDRVTTRNKCLPRDIVSVGKQQFLFGYNVHIGLRSETQLSDVFALYEHRDHEFHELPLELLSVAEFEADFKSLYKYYRQTVFARFSVIGPHLFLVFQVGKSLSDIKSFKWLLQEERLTYLGNRSDHEVCYPPQHEFEWIRTHRELHRFGLHPHISIADRVFVETIGGDLTIKVEDNTATGEGIYAEPVDNQDQTLDDAEVYYARLGNLILLKIRPYQEEPFRYLVYNEKLQQVRRIDAIADACVLLPDNQGIIFSSGYYLQTGEFKTFETALSGVRFDGRIQSPNGEDHLYRFYHPESGNYLLLSYNVIEQRVETPMLCG
ncbi:MAG TPA: DNA repair ATPase, partial [Candidatus Sulfotelmatobacter sp.]|nr:DNA repair ATPase [Candidatus Sulfotelmatobacter sp.]